MAVSIFGFRPRLRGLAARHKNPPQSGAELAKRTGQAKGRGSRRETALAALPARRWVQTCRESRPRLGWYRGGRRPHLTTETREPGNGQASWRPKCVRCLDGLVDLRGDLVTVCIANTKPGSGVQSPLGQ